MPTSPEAASVVVRLRRWSDDPGVTASHTGPLKADVQALLAVVEAAKLYVDIFTKGSKASQASPGRELVEALDALYTSDSAEERSSSKDAEGAKP